MKYLITTAIEGYKPVIVMHHTGKAMQENEPIVGERIEVNGELVRGTGGEILYIPANQVKLYPAPREYKWKAYINQQSGYIKHLQSVISQAEKSLEMSSLPVCSNPSWCPVHKVLYISDECVICILGTRKRHMAR